MDALSWGWPRVWLHQVLTFTRETALATRAQCWWAVPSAFHLDRLHLGKVPYLGNLPLHLFQQDQFLPW